MSISNPRWVEIYRAKNLPEAYVIRTSLAEAGVSARIDGELLQGAVGELPMGWVTAPRIQVDESQASVAREIIARADVHRKSTETHADDSADATSCLACGKAMSDSEVSCSSCGWSFLGEEAIELL